jgi:hypothetical protein
MPEYVVVFRDDRPPKECAFTAISDDAAQELMRKQYPGFAWSLYHVDGHDHRELFYSYAGRPIHGSGDEQSTGGEGATA